MLTLMIFAPSAAAVEVGLGARNTFDLPLAVDGPQLLVRQELGHFGVEGVASYGLSRVPSALSTVLVERAAQASAGDVSLGSVQERHDRLTLAALGTWDLGSPLQTDTGLSGSPMLIAGAELRTWEESSLSWGQDPIGVTEGDSAWGLSVGPVLGAGAVIRLDRLSLRLSMLDRTYIGRRSTRVDRPDAPVGWVHTPTVTFDALWNFGSTP